MINEEAIKQLKITKECDVDTVAQIKALDVAISALSNHPTGEPLTLEQLREMDGQPVFVVTKAGNKFWAIVTKHCVSSGDGRYLWISDEDTEYGKTWLAYAYPPAHIDREAWEPCGECAPNCSWCKHCQEISKTIPDICRECNHYSNYEPEYNFCCECGRPLTEEAWSILEKWLRG